MHDSKDASLRANKPRARIGGFDCLGRTCVWRKHDLELLIRRHVDRCPCLTGSSADVWNLNCCFFLVNCNNNLIHKVSFLARHVQCTFDRQVRMCMALHARMHQCVRAYVVKVRSNDMILSAFHWVSNYEFTKHSNNTQSAYIMRKCYLRTTQTE